LGVIPIENEKRVDWNAIRAEYIGGGTSYRKLAEKYQVSFMVLKTRAKKEDWPGLRTQAEHKASTEATQKTAEAAADNAAIAANIKKRLLLRLSRMEQKYPYDATEVRTHDGKNTVTFRIRDLTAAYKDLTSDMNLNANNEPVRIIIDV
jgi:outer membrane biosynthesis protein TonB